MRETFLATFTEGHPVNSQDLMVGFKELRNTPAEPFICAKESTFEPGMIMYWVECPACRDKPLIFGKVRCPNCDQLLDWHNFNNRVSILAQNVRYALSTYSEEKDYG